MFYKRIITILTISILFLSLTSFTQAQSWTQIISNGNTPSTPTMRGLHSAIYDVTNNRMTIFGGNTNGPTLNDVWVLSNTNGLDSTNPAWTQLFPTGSNSSIARWSHTASYDSTNNRMTVFGGWNGNIALNDIWVLSNANGLDSTSSAWTQLITAGSAPSPRCFHTAIYDTTNNRMTIFGGNSNLGVDLNDVWVLDDANGIVPVNDWMLYATELDDSHSISK